MKRKWSHAEANGQKDEFERSEAHVTTPGRPSFEPFHLLRRLLRLAVEAVLVRVQSVRRRCSMGTRLQKTVQETHTGNGQRDLKEKETEGDH